MFGRHDHERGAVQRVRSGREDSQLVAAGLGVVGRRGEDDLGAFRPADPVGLHDADRLGPFDTREVEQLVRVLGDAQVPLVQLALLHSSATAPAVAVRAFDLLAGQGPVVGAPVHWRAGTVGQARFQEAQEDPLIPAVIVRLAGDDLAVPVEAGAHRPQLAAHVVDVLQGPLARVDLVLDRGVLGGQAKGVEADRHEDVLAVHAMEAGDGVGWGLHVPVPDMEIPRRVVVHRQQVELGLGRVAQVRIVQAELRPALLPPRLNGRGLVAVDADAIHCRHERPHSLGSAVAVLRAATLERAFSVSEAAR